MKRSEAREDSQLVIGGAAVVGRVVSLYFAISMLDKQSQMAGSLNF